MSHEYAACALVELRQIGQPPSGTAPVVQHAPAAFNRIEVVAAPGRPARQATLFVPVGQRRREFVRSVDAPAVDDPPHRFPGLAQERQPL